MGADRRGTSVCLVERDPAALRLLAGVLETAGLRVVGAAGSAAAAVVAVERSRPDVAVVDTRLPDGRGVQLCRQLTGADPGLAVVLHAATVAPGEENEAERAGAVRLVAKSVRGVELISAIRACDTRPPAAAGSAGGGVTRWG